MKKKNVTFISFSVFLISVLLFLISNYSFSFDFYQSLLRPISAVVSSFILLFTYWLYYKLGYFNNILKPPRLKGLRKEQIFTNFAFLSSFWVLLHSLIEDLFSTEGLTTLIVLVIFIFGFGTILHLVQRKK